MMVARGFVCKGQIYICTRARLQLGVDICPPLLPQRHLFAELMEPVEVQLGGDKGAGVDVALVRREGGRASRCLCNDGPPRVDNHRVAVRLAVRRVLTDLCCGEDVRLGLDRTSAEEDLCMADKGGPECGQSGSLCHIDRVCILRP